MAETKKYVSLSKLAKYDELLKAKIKADDDAVLAAAKKYTDDAGALYDAAGSAASAETNAKSYTDAEVTKANSAAATAKTAADNAASAAATADGKAVAAQTAVDNLATYVGTIPDGATATNVVAYVQEKTAGIATEGAMTELTSRIGVVEGDVATIKNDYLKGADKTELVGDIAEVQTAVDTEKSRAEGIEAGLASRIKAVEDDYLKAADKAELQGNIDAVNDALELLSEGVDAEKVDGVKDLIAYVEEHGTEVTGIKEDIAENTEAIVGVTSRMSAAEGKITTLEGAVATKAEKTYVDEQVQTLSGVDSGLDTRLKAVEAKFADDDNSVADMIANAKQEAIDTAANDATTKANAAESNAKGYADSLNTAMNTRVEGLETASASHALKTEVEAVAGRMTTAEGEIDTLQTEMDAVEAKAVANETNITKKADKATSLSGYGIADAYTMTQTDAAIASAVGQFEECSEAEINAMFA